MTSITLTEEIIQFITICGETKYTIEKTTCGELKNKKNDLKALIEKNTECHAEYMDAEYKNCTHMENEDDNIIYLLMYYGNIIISYISYKIYIYNSTRCLYIKYMCTDDNHRKKNIIVLLSCLMFADAINKNIDIIITQVNELSGPLLQKKFGFTYITTQDNDFYQKNPIGLLSIGISMEINCFYELNNTSKKILIDNIRNVLQDCRLARTGGCINKFFYKLLCQNNKK